MRRRRASNPAAYRAKPENSRRNERNRRARKANAICQHGPGCFDRAAQSMPQRCSVSGCRRRKDIHADHIISLDKEGLDCRDNLQPLCKSHNSSKGNADPIAFRRRLGMLV